jgi:hemin uptake protein HemP
MSPDDRPPRPEGEEEAMKDDKPSIATVEAKKLLGERGVLRIDLDGEVYTLRMTRNGRLILTK